MNFGLALLVGFDESGATFCVASRFIIRDEDVSAFIPCLDGAGGKGGEGSIEAEGRGGNIGGRVVYDLEPLIGLVLGQIIETELFVMLP
jgi:hypothetical protein